MGFFITYLSVQPFIATLAGLWVARGLCFWISDDAIAIHNRLWDVLAQTRILIPGLADPVTKQGPFVSILVVVALVVLAVAIYVAQYTGFGRTVYAVGGNEASARLMGLRVNRTKMLVYTLNGFCSALAGHRASIDVASGHGLYAMGLELTVIGAVVIGGTLLTGGSGYVIGTLFGVLVIGVVQTLIQFNGQLSSWWTPIVVATLTLIFIGVQSFLASRSGPRSTARRASTEVAGPPPAGSGDRERGDMTGRRGWRWIVAFALVLSGCEYVVLPPEASAPVGGQTSKGWSAVATAVGPAESGDLRIDLAIHNETGDWSAMAAVRGRPAVLTAGDGSRTDCATVLVGSGGHRLAPGFRMQGFIAGPKTAPKIERIRVECAGATASPGSKLSIDYAYRTGEYDYYDAKTTGTEGKLEVNLDELAADLAFPVAEPDRGPDPAGRRRDPRPQRRRPDPDRRRSGPTRGSSSHGRRRTRASTRRSSTSATRPSSARTGSCTATTRVPTSASAPVTPPGDDGRLEDECRGARRRQGLLHPAERRGEEAAHVRELRDRHHRQVTQRDSAAWTVGDGRPARVGGLSGRATAGALSRTTSSVASVRLRTVAAPVRLARRCARTSRTASSPSSRSGWTTVVSDGVNWARLVESVEADDRDVVRDRRSRARWRRAARRAPSGRSRRRRRRGPGPRASSCVERRPRRWPTSSARHDRSGLEAGIAQRVAPAVVPIPRLAPARAGPRGGRSVGARARAGAPSPGARTAVVVDDDRRERRATAPTSGRRSAAQPAGSWARTVAMFVAESGAPRR